MSHKPFLGSAQVATQSGVGRKQCGIHLVPQVNPALPKGDSKGRAVTFSQRCSCSHRTGSGYSSSSCPKAGDPQHNTLLPLHLCFPVAWLQTRAEAPCEYFLIQQNRGVLLLHLLESNQETLQSQLPGHRFASSERGVSSSGCPLAGDLCDCGDRPASQAPHCRVIYPRAVKATQQSTRRMPSGRSQILNSPA